MYRGNDSIALIQRRRLPDDIPWKGQGAVPKKRHHTAIGNDKEYFAVRQQDETVLDIKGKYLMPGDDGHSQPFSWLPAESGDP
jgi:hypothetical protein